MSPEDDQTLRNTPAYKPLIPVVQSLLSRGESLDQAWLLAGALLAYTGIAAIPKDIIKAAGADPKDFPKVVGSINNFLRGKGTGGSPEQFGNLLDLLKAIEDLSDWNSGNNDPTRMMDHYDLIDEDYAVGNVLLMAEVGSVSRNRPAEGLYAKKYRIHISGGLKDISAMNPQQQEVIYAPGSAYLVENRRTGKVKDKKGHQAHEHIYLRYVSKGSREYSTAAANRKVFDLGDPKRHG